MSAMLALFISVSSLSAVSIWRGSHREDVNRERLAVKVGALFDVSPVGVHRGNVAARVSPAVWIGGKLSRPARFRAAPPPF